MRLNSRCSVIRKTSTATIFGCILKKLFSYFGGDFASKKSVLKRVLCSLCELNGSLLDVDTKPLQRQHWTVLSRTSILAKDLSEIVFIWNCIIVNRDLFASITLWSYLEVKGVERWTTKFHAQSSGIHDICHFVDTSTIFSSKFDTKKQRKQDFLHQRPQDFKAGLRAALLWPVWIPGAFN